MDETAARAAFDTAIGSYTRDFGSFFLARLFGLEIGYGEDSCTVAFEVRDFMFNPQGSLHGGVIALAMDIAMGHLLARKVGPGATLEMKTQFLRPVRAGRVVCEGRFAKQGRSISFLRAEMSDADGKLVAAATATWTLARA